MTIPEHIRTYVAQTASDNPDCILSVCQMLIHHLQQARAKRYEGRWRIFEAGYAHGYREALAQFKAGCFITDEDYARILEEGPKHGDRFTLDLGGDMCGDFVAPAGHGQRTDGDA